MDNAWRIPELAPLLQGADHVDVKMVAGRATLREFLAGMLSYQPGWVTMLYGVRRVLVRLLGLRQPGVPRARPLTPATVPLTAGARLGFFTVYAAEEERFWIGEAAERRLIAWLAVVAAPPVAGRTRFYVVTVVHYRNWAGPVYFNAIRPFHHLVVGRMARAGVAARG